MGRGSLQGRRSLIAVDAHAHYHPCFPLEPFLLSAARGLRLHGGGRPGALVLTEGRGERAFETLSRPGARSGWRVQSLEKGASFRLEGPGSGDELLVVRGRQLRAREGVEVLSVGAVRALDDGEPVATTIEAVRAAGGIPLLPWGFGKWWGRRGRVVLRCIEEAAPAELFLGDSGGRLARFGRPYPLVRARERGLRILSGSDPLPLAREGTRAGTFGSLLDVEIDPERPAASLLEALRKPTLGIVPFGRGLSPIHFVLNQAQMQWCRRRLGPRPEAGE